MADSATYSTNVTFTLTHAKHIAAKVATDLKRMQRFYGVPSDKDIAEYEAEVTQYLNYGYLDNVAYGFHRNGDWIEPTLFYRARDLVGAAANDDDPGRVKPNCDVTGATFYSYLMSSAAFQGAPPSTQADFRKLLPFSRMGAPAPGISGYVVKDKVYSSGGRALDRESVRSFS